MFQFSNLNREMRQKSISRNLMSLKKLMSKGTKQIILLFLISCVFVSCSPKLYFSVEQRNLIERNLISPTKLQYYVDKDVILKREVSSQEATTLTSGKIQVENGKYIHIIA